MSPEVSGGAAGAMMAVLGAGVGYAVAPKKHQVAGVIVGSTIGATLSSAFAAGLFNCCKELHDCNVRSGVAGTLSNGAFP